MAAAVNCFRAALRSSPSLRKAAVELAADAKCSRLPFSRMSKPNPNLPRFIRSPVEMSCCVETLLPLHSATASAVLTSMLAVSRSSFWLSEGQDETR